MKLGSIIVCCTLFLAISVSPSARTLTVERGSDLPSVIKNARDGDTLILAAASFEANPSEFIDPLCGSCQKPMTSVAASTGFVIKDKSLIIVGKNRWRTRLVTGAGYGVYFENSHGSQLRNLTITGGRRDPASDATNAGVVVRNSRIELVNVDIRDNDHRLDSVVVGIGGVFGREGANIVLQNCKIINNGWDGVTLYRGANGCVTDCQIKDGRGVGIRVTWDATCRALRNEISGYWKGIGAYGTSWVVARNNLVHNNLGWGIIATGQTHMDIVNNVVHHNGNCGIAPWSTESRGRVVNNIITENGWRDQWVCPCVGVWNYGDWAKWEFKHNIVFGNSAGEYQDIWDQTGLNGNLNDDPLFVNDSTFQVLPESPTIHGGDSLIINLDGTVSDIGLYGGPHAWQD